MKTTKEMASNSISTQPESTFLWGTQRPSKGQWPDPSLVSWKLMDHKKKDVHTTPDAANEGALNCCLAITNVYLLLLLYFIFVHITQHVGASFFKVDQTCSTCSRSGESWPLDGQGIPEMSFCKNILCVTKSGLSEACSLLFFHFLAVGIGLID